MIVICPSCDTHFSVADHLIGSKGRSLRCAQCQHQWRFIPPLADIEASLEAKGQSEPSPTDGTIDNIIDQGKSPLQAFTPPASSREADDMVEPSPSDDVISFPTQRPNRQKKKKWAILSIIILFIVGFLTFGYYFRNDFFHLGHDLKKQAGAWMDWHKEEETLEIANVKFTRQIDNGLDVVMIEGTIFNPSENIVPLPPIAAIAIDPSGREILPGRSFALIAQQIQPGETMDFRAIIRNLPKDAQHLRIGFTK